jgi:hypothetical protein
MEWYAVKPSNAEWSQAASFLSRPKARFRRRRGPGRDGLAPRDERVATVDLEPSGIVSCIPGSSHDGMRASLLSHVLHRDSGRRKGGG